MSGIGTRLAFRAFGVLHRTAYRIGVGRRMMGVPVLILKTRGRRSGREVQTALTYFEDAQGIFIIASKGGAPAPPAWWLNLQAEPAVTARIGTEDLSFRAETVADPSERDRLYAIAVAKMPAYAGYERKTTRRIPVVRLVRAAS